MNNAAEDHTRALAAQSLAAGDPTGWFERLYAAAESGHAEVPWDHPHVPLDTFAAWAEQRKPEGAGRRAVVVGCGLGDDAEHLAGLGFDTVGFDVADSGVRAAQHRYPDSAVTYVTADLLDLPEEWVGAFDFVMESRTVQSLPVDLHPRATEQVTSLVAPGGRLLVIATAAPEREIEGPPWPLTRAEIDAFATNDLTFAHLDLAEGDRWCAELRRAA